MSVDFMVPTTSVIAPVHAMIIGKPKSGKTTFALKWPRPLIWNFDNNAQPGFEEYRFWDTAFIDSITTRINKATPNFRDALILFSRNIDKLPQDRTLIVDSLSLIEAMYTTQEECGPLPMVKLKDGGGTVVDKQTLFGRRKLFYEQLFCKLRTYKGNVLVLVHQYNELNEDGNPTGFIYPAITGQMKTKMTGFFNNAWQAVCKEKAGGKLEYVMRVKNNPAIGLSTSFPCNVEELPQEYTAFLPYLGTK